MHKLMRKKFYDPFRHLHSLQQDFTFSHRNKDTIFEARLDYFLVNTRAILAVSECDILKDMLIDTDHKAITLRILLPKRRHQFIDYNRYKISWDMCSPEQIVSFSHSIANDTTLQGIEQKISHIDTQGHPTQHLMNEYTNTLLYTIRKRAKKHLPYTAPSRKRKVRTKHISIQGTKTLRNILLPIKAKLKRDIILSEDDIASLHSVCTQIHIEWHIPAVIDLNIINRIIKRFSKKHISDYFQRLNNHRLCNYLNNKKQILNSILNRTNDFNGVKITKTNGKLTDDPDQVLLNVSNHFESLFAPTNYDENTGSIQAYWHDNFPPLEHINPNIYSTLMQPVTILELQATISDSPKKKAPGLTGLTNEIWKHLPPLPLQIIVKLFNITMRTGFLPNKVNTGKIILLPKINNWA
ncbi:hypothetical protein ROZALSC1DRAFT_25331, partial [Rozella allomycis CSF55]